MVHLIAVFLFAVNTLTTSAFNCPPASEISPCECKTAVQAVVCDNIVSVDSLRSILRHRLRYPRLIVTRLESSPLPSRAFGNFKISNLHIRNSIIHRMEKDAFVGQDWLNVLHLEHSKLGDIDDLQNLTTLETLSLSGNLLTRIHNRSVSNLDDLLHLTLSDNAISEIAEDAFPKKLKTLRISGNQLRTFDGSLRSLEHLQKLYASNNRFASVNGEFVGLVRLKTLILDHNQISCISDSFPNLSSITRLSLSRNHIRDVGEALVDLNQLKALNLAHNRITVLNPEIFKNMKNLQSLDLSGNLLADFCSTINPLKALRSLKLSGMRITEMPFRCFGDAHNLTSLDLSHNQLSALRHPLADSHNLMYLDIRFNNFTSLRHLRLPDNQNLATVQTEGNPWVCTTPRMLVLRDLKERGYYIHGHPSC